jgi:hypothetical protein
MTPWIQYNNNTVRITVTYRAIICLIVHSTATVTATSACTHAVEVQVKIDVVVAIFLIVVISA